MKIGLVMPYDWSYPGGVRNHISHLANQFLEMGQDVRILAPASGRKGKLLEKHIYRMGWTTPIPINGSVARITFDPRLIGWVGRVLQGEEFDVIHLHEPLVPGLSLAALQGSHMIKVGTFHAFAHSSLTSTPSLAYTSAYPFLCRYFRRLAGRVAVSPAAYHFVSHHFPAEYRIIPNGVNLEHYHPGVVPLPQFMDGKQNILFVGRFEKRKGAKYLLRAIPSIRELHPNTRFLFVGEGPLRRGFQCFVEQQGWQDVIFTGYISDEELPRYYASADVFCAPSTGSESMGIVLLEAMASGTPIVATNIEGYAAIVSSGVDALLTTPSNSEALAWAIGQVLENKALRLQFIQAGLRKVRGYAWPDVARRVLEYYYELLAENDKCLAC